MSTVLGDESQATHIAIEPWTVYATALRELSEGEPVFLIDPGVAPPPSTYLASCRGESGEEHEVRVTVEDRPPGVRSGSTRIVVADSGPTPPSGTVAITFRAWLP